MEHCYFDCINSSQTLKLRVEMSIINSYPVHFPPLFTDIYKLYMSVFLIEKKISSSRDFLFSLKCSSSLSEGACVPAGLS